MKRVYALIAFLAVFGLPLVALAQEAAEPVAVQALTYALEVTAAVLMLAVAWVTTKVSGYIKRKTGIEVEAMIAEWAAKGVDYAEEQASKKLKESGEKLRGNDKLETAVGFVLGLARENNLDNVAREKIVGYVEAKLGHDRPVGP